MGNLKLRIGFSSAVQVRGVANVLLHTNPSPQPTVVVTPGRIFIQEGEMFLLEKKKKRKVRKKTKQNCELIINNGCYRFGYYCLVTYY